MLYSSATGRHAIPFFKINVMAKRIGRLQGGEPRCCWQCRFIALATNVEAESHIFTDCFACTKLVLREEHANCGRDPLLLAIRLRHLERGAPDGVRVARTARGAGEHRALVVPLLFEAILERGCL